MIKIENIGKVFNSHSRNRNEVLKGVSFELPEKGLICIYGKSGSGKTTLLNIIGGLDKQDKGKLYIDGEDVKNNTDRIRNQKIGFIFQNYYLEKGYTISEIMRNAMYIAGFKDEKEIIKRSHEVLTLVGMERFKNKQADALSGGQKQRVAIARALIKGAEIILADEPTGNLDADNTMKVMDILKEISKTRLVVVVTHEVTLIKKYADSYIQLVDGQLTDKDVIGEVFKYETEKNNIFLDKNSSRNIVDGNLNVKVYGDPCVDIDDLQIVSDKGKIYIKASHNVTILDDKSEKKLVFSGSKEEQKIKDPLIVPKFEQSQNKKNGRLFNFKNVFQARKKISDEKIYSTANIFKQIFIGVIAVVMCFFSLAGFEVLRTNLDNKMLDDKSLYVNLNTYNDIKQLDDSLYESIDFFETQMKKGNFSYNGITALSGIEVGYTPKAIEKNMTAESLNIVYGSMPKENQVLITRGLAEKLKKQFRIEELSNDKAIPMVIFENVYSVSGIVDDECSAVYMHKNDYVNFLGVYDSIQFLDPGNIFFENDYIKNTYTSEILVIDEDPNESIDENEINEVNIEISRNALYKMMPDTVQADYRVKSANSVLRNTVGRTGIEINNSNLYVRKMSITRDAMETDIRIYVHSKALDNIFVYLEPNLNSLNNNVKDENGRTLGHYFEINTNGGEQLENLKSRLNQRNIPLVDIASEYEQDEKDIIDNATSNLTIFFVVAVLLFIVYFFVEKSSSLKNAKEYGIYRAIGVNKLNLLYKESVLAIFDNLICYFSVFLLTSILMCVRYGIMNVAFVEFIGILLGVFIFSSLILMIISLIPYLFVLYQTPSQILSKYDI